MAAPWNLVLPDGWPANDDGAAGPVPYDPGDPAGYFADAAEPGPPRDFAMTVVGGLATNGQAMHVTRGKVAIAQQVAINFRIIQGECIWDLDLGVNYQRLAQPGVTDSDRQIELSRVALRVPGVKAVQELALTRDPVTRQLSVRALLDSDLGLVDAAVKLLEGA